MARKAEQRGTNNVLADPGFPDADELTAKTILAKKVNDAVNIDHLARLRRRRSPACRYPGCRRSETRSSGAFRLSALSGR